MVQQSAGQERIVTVDPESVAEVARITKWQQLITQSMGGLFPEHPDPSSLQQILDINCGPGAWALEVAFTYPDAMLCGIDANHIIVRYAQAQAQTMSLKNVCFRQMDVLDQLDFPDQSFDLINIQFADNCIPANSWSDLLHTCYQVLRPVGRVRITTSELIVTNSSAYEELLRLYILALHKAGYCIASNGYYTGTAMYLIQALHHAGYVSVQQRPYVINFSQDSKASEDNYANFFVVMPLIKPFLLKMEVVTEKRFEQLFREATIDLLSDTYCGMWHFQTIWGEVPR
jgi:ubiquinone/menaquinone biosynthesis C-methylase UbiE